MNDNRSHGELVLRSREGDSDAFELLVDRFNPLVWSICRNAGLETVDAEDVAQGTWLSVVQSLEKLQDPERFPGWLATIARNECIAVVRRAVRSRSLFDRSRQEAVESNADDVILEAERATAVRAAFANLDARCRTLLSMLTSSSPSSYVQIGEVLSIPVASIGPTRARCLDKLRRSSAIASVMER